MNLLQKLALSRPFRVSDSRGVSRLCQDDIRPKLVDPRGTQMAVSAHVVVASVHERLSVALDVEHRSTEHMPSVVRSYFHLAIAQSDRLMQRNRRNFRNAVFNHVRVEAVVFFFLGDTNFTEVLEH